MNDDIGFDRMTLAIEELRGRLLALSDGRKVLPSWVNVGDVLRVIDEWESDFGEEPPSFTTRASYTFVDIPVIDGVARLPDGRTVQSTADIVRVPVLLDEVPA